MAASAAEQAPGAPGSIQPADKDGGSGQAQLRFLRPKNYTLPQECIQHELLYPPIFDLLRPYFVRGIRREDFDACVPAAPKDFNIDQGTPGQSKFRMLLWDNEVWVISGGLRRQMFQMLDYGQVMQIQAVAKRWGLPNMEFVVGWGDIFGVKDDGDRRCPLFTYCRSPESYDILIPDGHFLQFKYDEWVEKMKGGGDVPWEQKEERAVGYWHGYCAYLPQADRFGRSEKCIRAAYVNQSALGTNLTAFSTGEREALSLQARFKYTLSTDGLGCSGRFQKLLATGQVEFFYPALRPWVHYVPSGYNGIEEIERIVQFLRANDDMAKAIGQNSQRFAREHLNEEARHCYLKVLMEEMHKLITYSPKLEDFPTRITFDEDMKKYAKEELQRPSVEAR
ncbi:hypothetical protein CHLNCDRAFT_139417 [Chlorella variabilis]|uniref:Glycosyl transferase CAP10 domain-containing protein n=1 Tax=Chlorella variabilis TaxID=554065 RepID=E1ZPR6_CHLVA|nr:hypothetical protein CHLNCDRAFT_139417 [Chlorella variabilis]EFN52111.1 hypothetical protein CHLNCDRAFT_139417 [Chlorella variabilis]|eukprot:XP_005844213.1 hypothetical protein CHLNCDRAFT_139417 [Chlorella variabilis]